MVKVKKVSSFKRLKSISLNSAYFESLLTARKIGARIAQLMDAGVIKNYTIAVQYRHKQFIHLHLNEQRSFEEIENLVKQYEQIDECFKVMGNACYMIVSHFEPAELNAFIEVLSKWCRYSVETVIREVEKA